MTLRSSPGALRSVTTGADVLRPSKEKSAMIRVLFVVLSMAMVSLTACGGPCRLYCPCGHVEEGNSCTDCRTCPGDAATD
jgi:hypothetical protein